MASEIFGNSAFTRFWTARSASGFAYHMTAVAVGWQVYDLTGSALMLGLVGLVEFLPQFLLTLVVGQVADRFDRRRIAGVCQLVEAAALLLLLAEAAGGLLGLGGIFACVALIGAARAFETPTLQALLPSLVAPESLPRMLAWSGSVWKTAMILGPAAGGVLFMLGPGVVYGLGALVYVLASLAVLSIPAAAKVPAPAGRGRHRPGGAQRKGPNAPLGQPPPKRPRRCPGLPWGRLPRIEKAARRSFGRPGRRYGRAGLAWGICGYGRYGVF